MISPKSKQPTTSAEQFVERYGVTPRFFVGSCLLPALLAVRRVSCFYRGVLVETLEGPACKTRLRALRTVFAMAAAEEIQEKRIKVPLGALGPAQLGTIADGFLETDWRWITAEFLVVNCLMPASEASNSAFLFHLGRLVDSFQFEDAGTQVEAAAIALKVHRAYANECDNIQFATYRDIALLVSEARRNSRAIQIVQQSQVVFVR